MIGMREVTIRKRLLGEEEGPYPGETIPPPDKRVGLVWELTELAWALRERSSAEPRLSQLLVRVLRRES
jgi:hypothetical protein